MKVGICCLIKNEHDYLEEWINHNLNLGVTDLYLFEDPTSESHAEICNKYKLVHLSILDQELVQKKYNIPDLELTFNWFIKEYKNKLDWCLFIDVDEFLVFKNDWNLQKYIEQYSDYASIIFFWKYMLAGIHKLEGNLCDNYTEEYNGIYKKEWNFKSLVNFKHSEILNLNFKIINNHRICRNFVTECGNIGNATLYWLESPTYENAYIKHFYTKSYEEWLIKLFSRGDVCYEVLKFNAFFDINTHLKKEDLIPSVEDIVLKFYTGGDIDKFKEHVERLMQ